MPINLTQAQPLQAAVNGLSEKTPIGAALRSKDWEEKVPAGLKNGAIWSARVEDVRVIARMQSAIGNILGEVRAAHGGLAMDRSKFVRDIQQLANAEGLRTQDQAKRGTVQDFGSERRLKLVLDQVIGSAQAKAYWQQGQDPDLLDAFPAQELVRVRSVKAPRDWWARWIKAAEEVNWQGVAPASSGRMIALKNSPIWTKLSRFGRPWPPFDFNSGMGLEEIDRETAEALGIIKPGEKAQPAEGDFNADLVASVRGLSPEAQALLKKQFGGQVEIADGVAKWSGGAELRPSTSNVQRPTSNIQGEDGAAGAAKDGKNANDATDRTDAARAADAGEWNAEAGAGRKARSKMTIPTAGTLLQEEGFALGPGKFLDGEMRYAVTSQATGETVQRTAQEIMDFLVTRRGAAQVKKAEKAAEKDPDLL